MVDDTQAGPLREYGARQVSSCVAKEGGFFVRASAIDAFFALLQGERSPVTAGTRAEVSVTGVSPYTLWIIKQVVATEMKGGSPQNKVGQAGAARAGGRSSKVIDHGFHEVWKEHSPIEAPRAAGV